MSHLRWGISWNNSNLDHYEKRLENKNIVFFSLINLTFWIFRGGITSNVCQKFTPPTKSVTYNQEPGPGASLEGGNYFPSQRNDEVSERTSSTSQSTILISPGMYIVQWTKYKQSQNSNFETPNFKIKSKFCLTIFSEKAKMGEFFTPLGTVQCSEVWI